MSPLYIANPNPVTGSYINIYECRLIIAIHFAMPLNNVLYHIVTVEGVKSRLQHMILRIFLLLQYEGANLTSTHIFLPLVIYSSFSYLFPSSLLHTDTVTQFFHFLYIKLLFPTTQRSVCYGKNLVWL